MVTKKKQRGNYPVNQSPLYKLQSRRRLASLLRTDIQSLETLAACNNNYRVFPLGKRTCHDPKPQLRAIHGILKVFLCRIVPAEYLHSATKGKSYITNAAAHIGNPVLHKLDIRHFYDSTTYKHVFDFFKNTMECSIDAATLLAKICTYNDHLPTGSPLSPILAYYAHKTLFDQMHCESKKKGVTMTCYVDDLTFSGVTIPKGLLHKIKTQIVGRGLEYHKEKRFSEGAVKIVTGVGISGGKMVLPNKRHLKIYEEKKRSLKCQNTKEKKEIVRCLISRAAEAARIDPKFEQLKNTLVQVNRSIQTHES